MTSVQQTTNAPAENALMSMDMSTVPASSLAEPFRVTPFLNSPHALLTPSPWMMLDMDSLTKGGKTPEATMALLASQQKGGGVTHVSERNKFEKSFGMALVKGGGDIGGLTSSQKDAEVPEMNDVQTPKAVIRAEGARSIVGTMDMDRSVPQTTGTNGTQTASQRRKRAAVSESERKAKRREQNRRNAAKCRQRKIDRVNELTKQLEALRKENMTLKTAHAKLAKKLADLEK